MNLGKPRLIRSGVLVLVITSLLVCNLAFTAELYLPGGIWPDDSGRALAIEEEYLQEKAQDYCEEPIGDDSLGKSAEDFIMGAIAIDAFDGICQFSAEEIRMALGNLYVSGVLGGIWLRDGLVRNPNEIAAAKELLSENFGPLSTTADETHSRDPVFNRTFKLLDANAYRLLNSSSQHFSRQRWRLIYSLPLSLMVTGYNKGYLEYILDHPPQNVDAPVEYIVCDHFLNCKRPGLSLAPFDQYEGVINHLKRPGGQLKWHLMKLLVFTVGRGSEFIGAGVWRIISVGNMSPTGYDLLIDLSAKFLMVSEVSILATMEALSNRDEDAGRCAHLQQAAMLVWSGPYLSGLASSQEPGTFASLQCN